MIKRLEKEEQDEDLQKLASKLNDWCRTSRSFMSERYNQWDRNNDAYKGIRPPDREDMEAREMDEPEKFVVPMTYSQIQSYISFAFQLYKQNDVLLGYDPRGPEDWGYRHVVETTIERDLIRNNFDPKLYQWMLDLCRFSIGVFKHWWVEEKKLVPIRETTQLGSEGFSFGEDVSTTWREATVYEGNKIINIDPYNFYPDTRLPLTRWMEGEFCADEQEYTLHQLKNLENDGTIAGLEYVEGVSSRDFEERVGSRLPAVQQEVDKKGRTDNTFWITEFQAKLIPSKWDLGEETKPVLFILWLANDNRIIRIERAPFVHCEFTYDVAQFSPDMHQKLNEALADTTFPMQDTATFLMNSRQISVRRSLDNHLIVDPEVIDTAGFENRSPIIYTRKNAPKMGGVRDAVHQLNIVDTTANHMNDVDMLIRMAQQATGINENAMGQYHSGRRSAAESRVVNQGAFGRQKLIAQLSWKQCIAPMGRKLLLQQRSALSEKTFMKIVGEDPRATEYWARFHPDDPEALISNEDFFVFDSTMATEKGFIAQSLQEILVAIIANPQLAIELDLDVKGMLDEIQTLRGSGPLSRFSLRRRLMEDQLQNGQLPDLRPVGIEESAGGPPGVPTQPGI